MGPAAVGPPWWDDQPVILVGGGPSLIGFDFERLRGIPAHLVGVNQAMLDLASRGLPIAAGLTIDVHFLTERATALGVFAKHAPLYVVIGPEQQALVPPDATWLDSEDRDNHAAPQGNRVIKAATSGEAALDFALLKRGRRIGLLGYDYGVAAGRHHYHDAYPWHNTANDQSWWRWAERFEAFVPDCVRRGVTVLNASPQSAIECFPKLTIEAALEALAGHA